MPSKQHADDPMMNQLLAALPANEFAHIKGQLKPVSLSLDETIKESDVELEYVYFPTTSIISLFHMLEDGSTIDIAMVGNDGLLGHAIFMGGSTTPHMAIARNNGNAYCLRAAVIKDEFSNCGSFQELLLTYTQYLMTQIAQISVCNSLHSVEQRLCRWLLLNHDLQEKNKLVITHELIAAMLGVRREGISIAAADLKKNKLINYSRGTITITNRNRLQEKACECYQVVKEEYDRLLGKFISKNI